LNQYSNVGVKKPRDGIDGIEPRTKCPGFYFTTSVALSAVYAVLLFSCRHANAS